MGIRKVIWASCGKGCTEAKTFPADEEDEARRWLESHEATHANPVVYVGKHDPRRQARF